MLERRPHMPQAALEFRNVRASRGNQLLLDQVSFKSAAGQVIWIRGTNGIGKTTLLRLAAGFTRPDRGQVEWTLSGTPCKPAEIIAYQGHKDAIKPDLSVTEELSFWAEIYEYGFEVSNLLGRINMLGRESILNRDLSAGQRRRLALGRLLISQRPIWIMDEPAAAMDMTGQALIFDIIAQHVASGGTVILASHEKAQKIGDNTAVLTLEEQT